jgi:hypothetical protein
MPRPASVQVREHLQAYLLGVESLPNLHAWLVGWRRTNPGSGDALTHDIEIRLAEYERGHWSDGQLRGLLLNLLEGPTLAPSRVEEPDVFQPYGRYEARSEGISLS